MDTNEHKLKITGRCNIMSGLTIGKDYDFTLTNAECRKIEEVPTDDNKVDKIYSLKISETSEMNIIGSKEVIKSKNKKSQSQILRWKIEQRWQDTNSDLEKEDFYIKEMSRIISLY